MFRITRGHHVQHVHFPLPVIRDLDALHDEAMPGNASPPKATASSTEATAEADASTETPQRHDPPAGLRTRVRETPHTAGPPSPRRRTS